MKRINHTKIACVSHIFEKWYPPRCPVFIEETPPALNPLVTGRWDIFMGIWVIPKKRVYTSHNSIFCAQVGIQFKGASSMFAYSVQIIRNYVVGQVVRTRDIQLKYFPTIPVYASIYREAKRLYFVVAICMPNLIGSWADILSSS